MQGLISLYLILVIKYPILLDRARNFNFIVFLFSAKSSPIIEKCIEDVMPIIY
jgi:hypothetical protein